MTDGSLRGLVLRELGAVTVGLHEGVTTGFSKAQTAWGRLSEREYGWLLSMFARARMREYWEQNLPGLGWAVGGNVALMGQTILVSPDGSLTLRLLKEHPGVHPGGVPYAGPTKARQVSWAQDPLPGMGHLGSAEAVARAAECLLLWDCIWDKGVPALTARVVHTIGPGRYGVRVPIDLSFRIDPSGTMHDQMAFTGEAQMEDLFPNIDRKDNEEDASGQ